ncbi:CDK2-associated and cullin domain-containing protein 1-like isoform X1 [Salvelinus fontinalis]|uniref:CDK2-associated and cullin domain-containing protein 1-like isoform X1 n=1 Tax=Salvelinus fontinalis TaxID=8038 RepID=UPI0024858CBA|nr:CDK2-associated and cullin domain-containing protein 1-like isoform X1 [Salvelinus fontinalis]XP_055757864.1 CDK2-associated and cullin domain-containing protein 1-like isoform X1 [Salvelinus fontinalis]
MEDMEDDCFVLNDDYNHNYCANSASGQVLYLGNELSDVPQPLSISPVLATRDVAAQENHSKVCSSSSSGLKFMDSDSSSVNSDTSETDSPSSASIAGKLTLNSASKFRSRQALMTVMTFAPYGWKVLVWNQWCSGAWRIMNAMTEEDYRTTYWPNLEKAIDHLLIQNPMDHMSISYEQIYSCVYKCVCQQHSELLYKDLMLKITTHLRQVSSDLQISPPGNFIENFNIALTRYTDALQCIVPVFIYMNKFYIETKLNRDLREDLMKLFTDHVAEKHVNALIPLLLEAHSMPFQVRPSTMASVVKGLYTLWPDWAHLAPALFSGFIPQINPPTVESQLSDYAARDQKLQMELSLNGFPRGDQSRKRASE